MSLMLDALKRIETKQSRSSARKGAEPASEQEPSVLSTQYSVPKSLPEDAAPPEPASVLSTQYSVPKSLPEDAAPPEPASLDGAIETDLQSVATEVEAIEIPPALAADNLPSMPLEDFALPEAASLETAIDQLQAYVAEAVDAAPACDVPPPMWEIELDSPVAEIHGAAEFAGGRTAGHRAGGTRSVCRGGASHPPAVAARSCASAVVHQCGGRPGQDDDAGPAGAVAGPGHGRQRAGGGRQLPQSGHGPLAGRGAGVAAAGCPCRRCRLVRGSAIHRPAAREPAARRARRPGRRPECPRHEPPAARSCRAL